MLLGDERQIQPHISMMSKSKAMMSFHLKLQIPRILESFMGNENKIKYSIYIISSGKHLEIGKHGAGKFRVIYQRISFFLIGVSCTTMK